MKFIFEVRVKPGYSAEEYAEAWVRASEIIQRTPGARGTYLHRKIGDPERLLAIAHWDSKAARDAKDDRRDETVRRILEKHARTCEFTLIGEFEEPEWAVLPEIRSPKANTESPAGGDSEG
ncbi:MAG: hypothetical protein AMXMBFR26_06840 [Porticoccaceae bacterium]